MMASLTPERTPSTGSVVVQRRFSRILQAPVVQSTPGGPAIHVEGDETADPGGTAKDSSGRILNPEAMTFGALVAKTIAASLAALAFAAFLGGEAFLLAASQLFGFALLLVVTFTACTGLYLWWGAAYHHATNLTVRRVLMVYLACSCSDIAARWITAYAQFPNVGRLPTIDAGYFVVLTTLLFTSFSLVAHRGGLNAAFSQESSVFVGLTLLLNVVATALFAPSLSVLYPPQLVYVSTLLGLTLSLLGDRFPRFSPSSVYWLLTHRDRLRHSSLRPGGGRVSIGSSTQSSKPPRTPLSSVSSLTSVMTRGYGSHNVDADVVTEAHGMIGDLMLNPELSAEAKQKLKKVGELLAPKTSSVMAFPSVNVGSQIGEEDPDYGSVTSSSIMSQFTPIHIRHEQMRRSSQTHHRRSTTHFSTTTSSTGMPVIEPQPSDRRRSLAVREVRARVTGQEKRTSVHKMSRERLGSGSKPISSTSESAPHLSVPETSKRVSSPASGLFHSTSSPLTTSQTSRSVSASSPPLSPSPGDTVSLGKGKESGRQPVAEGDDTRGSLLKAIPTRVVESLREEEEEEEGKRGGAIELAGADADTDAFDGHEVALSKAKDGVVTQLSRGTRGSYAVFSEYKSPDYSYSLSSYAEGGMEVLEQAATWDFPIFTLEESADGHILSHMAFVLFQEAGLLETFHIPQREFVNFFRALETNYGSNVYHNKTHAADVLHATSYLLFEMIPEFSHEFSDSSTRVWRGHQHKSGGNIASAFSILEVFACYMAAAMHDFDHPGRTNAFLVATNSPLAVLYNDRSVLENHHAAASWDLLTAVPEHNILMDFDPTELKRLRFLIIEGILATDLKMHFDLLSEFKTKVDPDDGGGLEWDSEVDRLMVMKMIIKMSDINTPAKSYDLHRAWSKRITEEFYQQSENEQELGLPGTIFMDRRHPEKLPAIQLSFIQNLVAPLFHACAEAGIIPGILELAPPTTSSPSPPHPARSADTHSEGEATSDEQTRSELVVQKVASLERDSSLDMGDEASTLYKGARHNFLSIILTNLQVNYEGWQAELPREVKEEEREEDDEVFGEGQSSDQSSGTTNSVRPNTVVPKVKIQSSSDC